MLINYTLSLTLSLLVEVTKTVELQTMFPVRKDEPKYAFLQDKNSKDKNRYGKAIELTIDGDSLRDQSLNINNDSEIGDNPNRYKQHGFYFTADNCIACHACEAACSEKNDNAGHIAFRSWNRIVFRVLLTPRLEFLSNRW